MGMGNDPGAGFNGKCGDWEGKNEKNRSVG